MGHAQDLVEQWKRTKLPADVEERLSMEAYEAVLQEAVIAPLRAHHIGCVMAFLSAQELSSQSLRTDAGGAVKLRADPHSRLSYHLQVRVAAVCAVLDSTSSTGSASAAHVVVHCLHRVVYNARSCQSAAAGKPVDVTPSGAQIQ